MLTHGPIPDLLFRHEAPTVPKVLNYVPAIVAKLRARGEEAGVPSPKSFPFIREEEPIEKKHRRLGLESKEIQVFPHRPGPQKLFLAIEAPKAHLQYSLRASWILDGRVGEQRLDATGRERLL